MRLEIDEQRAIATLLPPQRHVVHAQYTRTALSIGIRERVQYPQEGVGAGRHTGLARETSATFACGLQCKTWSTDRSQR